MLDHGDVELAAVGAAALAIAIAIAIAHRVANAIMFAHAIVSGVTRESS
jgi:hypothetical protein